MAHNFLGRYRSVRLCASCYRRSSPTVVVVGLWLRRFKFQESSPVGLDASQFPRAAYRSLAGRGSFQRPLFAPSHARRARFRPLGNWARTPLPGCEDRLKHIHLLSRAEQQPSWPRRQLQRHLPTASPIRPHHPPGTRFRHHFRYRLVCRRQVR